MKILTELNYLSKQKLEDILLILISRKKITIEDILDLQDRVVKRNELLRNYSELTSLLNLKTKFGIKKLSKLINLVPYQAYTFDKFLIPKIYESEIEEAIGEHYNPEKRLSLEEDIFKELSYLNIFIKQTRSEYIGRYRFQDYKYVVYLFKHRYLCLYIKNNPDQCKLSLQIDNEGRKFLSVVIKEKYKFHIPDDKIIYKKVKNLVPKEEKEYIPDSSEIFEKRSEDYFNKMYILMMYYLNFVLV